MRANQEKILKISQKVNDFFQLMWYNLTNIMGIYVKLSKNVLIP